MSFLGKPTPEATVFLHPADGNGDVTVPHPRGVVKADGTFVLGTYEKGDGAPPGEYTVTVQWLQRRNGAEGMPSNVLPEKYANPKTSGLTVKITAGKNDLPAIDLKR